MCYNPMSGKKRVYDLLSRVGLPRSAAQVEPTRLSGGQNNVWRLHVP